MLENFDFCFKTRNTVNTELLFADQEMEGLKEGKMKIKCGMERKKCSELCGVTALINFYGQDDICVQISEYNYAKLRIQERLAREGIKNKILYESIHLDPERKQTNGGCGSSNRAVLSLENLDTTHFSVNKAEINYRKHFMYHKKSFNQVKKVCISKLPDINNKNVPLE
eukprot:bmy_11896T0